MTHPFPLRILIVLGPHVEATTGAINVDINFVGVHI